MKQNRLAQLRPHAALAVLLIAWSAWSIVGIFHGVVNPFETAVYVNGGKRLLMGQHIYVDFFSIYGAATYYPFALTQMFFSRPQVSAGLVFFAFALANSLLTYMVATRLVQWRAFRWIAVLANFTGYNGGGRLTFALLAMLALFAFARNGRKSWAMLAGVLAAANLTMQQDMAAYCTVAAALAAALMAFNAARSEGKQRMVESAVGAGISVVGGSMMAAGFWLAWMQVTSSATAYVHHAFVIPLKFYDTLKMGNIPPIWSPPPLPPDVVSMWARFGIDGLVRWFIYTFPFYWIPAICIVTSVWCGAKLVLGAKSREDAEWHGKTLAVAAIGAFMARTIIRTGDEIKLVVNAMPAILVAGAWLSHFWRAAASLPVDSPRRRVFLRPAGFATALVTAMLTVYVVYPNLQDAIKSRLHGNSVAASADIQDAGNADIVRVSAYLNAQRGANGLFCVPNVPILYLITGLKNVTSYDYLDPIIDPEVSPRLLSQLQERQPTFVVVNENVRFWNRYEFGKDFGRPISTYIAGNYKEVYASGTYHVLQRGDVPAALGNETSAKKED